MKRLLSLLVVVTLVGAGAGYWYWHHNGTHGPGFRTVSVERGDLLATISATGVIEPEEVVDVGAQVAGMIQSFGRDPRDSSKPIDYGSPVEEGTVLARIDEALYQSQVDRTRAQVDQ